MTRKLNWNRKRCQWWQGAREPEVINYGTANQIGGFAIEHENFLLNIPTRKRFRITIIVISNTSEVSENEKCCGNECFHSNFEFSQTFTSVRITLWKHRENAFYCFYEIKARSNFLCFHRVMVNGFEPIRARVVSCLFHKRKWCTLQV